MSRVLRLGFILSLMIWSGHALAGEQPPPGDAYGNVRDGMQLEAYNYFEGPDGQWIYVNTDHTGKFNWLLGISRGDDNDYIDAYFKANSGDDLSRRAFDIIEYLGNGDTNHYQGWTTSGQSTGADGNTDTWWQMQVNGEYHAVFVKTDPSGNIVSSQTVRDDHPRDRRDPCDVIADFGVVQCPKNLTAGPKQIPANVLSVLRSAGIGDWFSDAYHSVANAVSSAATALANSLKDPQVQVALVAVAAVCTIAACCIGSVGTACAICTVGAVSADFAATGSILSSNTPESTARSSSLRSHNIIGCENANCYVNTTYTCYPNDPVIPCL